MSWLSWYYARRKYKAKRKTPPRILYEKKKFISYQNPGVFEADFHKPEYDNERKQSWWKRLLSNFSRKKQNKKNIDEYEKGLDRVRKIINK
jgi:hypothetical protein